VQPENDLCSIIFTEEEILSVVKYLHPSNALELKLFTDEGNV
jgi:hypothetical protein